MYWVYILENEAGRFYIGQTDDLQRRVAEHNDPNRDKKKYTAKNAGQWRLVWSEQHPDRSAAMKREKQIKAMKSAKWIRTELLSKSAEQSQYDRD